MNEGVPKTPAKEQEKPMNETPQFIKDFSRGSSQEERDQLARTLREKRHERDVWRQEHGELIAEEERAVAELNELSNQIEGYNSEGFLQKITGYLKYKETRAKLTERQGKLAEAQQARTEKEGTPPQFEEPKRLLEEFYKGEEKRWAEAGYTKEDIQKYFSEENLSKLSVEEYALLMRRFPGEMVTHVTRQGIRDHSSSFWHTAGEGKFLNGFKDVLLDGRLRSALGIALQEHSKEEAIVKFLKLNEVNSRDEALAQLSRKFKSSLSTSEAFADGSSVHLASEVVMDKMYGSEGGNEIFFAFPSAYIASGFHYGGKGDLFGGTTDQHNDKWIHTKDHEGIPLDTGLVFISGDAMVDAETGSKYALNEMGEPTIPQKRIDEILSARFEKLGFIQTFVQKLSWQLETLSIEEREQFAESAFQKFGITDPEAKKALLDPEFLEIIGKLWGKDGEQDKYREIVGKYFDEHAGSRYELAQNPISSREYWEKYFTEHPDQRPSKIVYYTGGDPSRAMNDWRRENKIVKKTSDKAFGFQENRVTENSPETNQGKDRFMDLARKIINDRFPEVRDPDEDHDFEEAEMTV